MRQCWVCGDPVEGGGACPTCLHYTRTSLLIERGMVKVP